ncbi:MAG: aminopeptidase [Lentimonas sp.]|jgi:aminopeptidase
MILDPSQRAFPPFSLSRLLKTSFGPGSGEKVCVLIDLPNPADIQDFKFLSDETLSIQNYGHEVFYKGFKQGVLEEMNWRGGEIFAYKETGGSNLDMSDECFDPAGNELSLDKDIYSNYDIILTVSTFSATAPLTAKCKKFGFRGATLHGLNQVILDTGLSVDYNVVSEEAEKLRLGLTQAERFEIDFEVENKVYTLKLYTNGQEAQKSHGLCPAGKPDVANLPAGEVYFVPESADGVFPFKYDESTIGLLHVENGMIIKSQFVYGDYAEIEDHNRRLKDDPMIGAIGELGFGTQVLPFSGRDIQDEKILGTIHVATGRDDHLGGKITPDLFKEHINASHDDVLYAPHKTPEIRLQEARMIKDGQSTVLIRHYKPSEYMINLLQAALPVEA